MMKKIRIQAFGSGDSIDLEDEMANRLIPHNNELSVIQPQAIPSILKAAIVWRSTLHESELPFSEPVDKFMTLMHQAKMTNSPVKCVPYEDHKERSPHPLSFIL